MQNTTSLNTFGAFVDILCFFSPKKGWETRVFIQNGLSDHLLLKTLYLVTTAIDSRQTYVKICVRDMRAATENGRRRRRRKIILEKVWFDLALISPVNGLKAILSNN